MNKGKNKNHYSMRIRRKQLRLEIDGFLDIPNN